MTRDVAFAEVQWGAQPVRIEYQWLCGHNTDAPLMVFLHEGLGSVSMWRDFPLRLCESLGCRGLVYSRPAYGQSTARPDAEHWRPDFMHRQACEVLPALLQVLAVDVSKTKVWLFGHSDGGSIALLYAARFSKHLQGVVVLAPHVMVEDISVKSIGQARIAYLETDLRARLARHHANPDSAFWGWNDIWLDAEFRHWDIRSELDRIACPILAVQGVNDEYGTLEQVREIARKAPQCELLELANCGHSPHKDRRDRLIEAVSHFYQRQHEETSP
jgi:pimeloyl-ACP methyl ester carboxylesterase